MDTVQARGFIVQSTVTPLNLKESEHLPILFIMEEKRFVKTSNKNSLTNYKNQQESPVVYWEYFDEDRQTFEETLFKTYEKSTFQENPDITRIRKYLNVCRIMCRGGDVEEARRIFNQVSVAFENIDVFLMLELLETVCLDIDTVLFIFNVAGSRNSTFLQCLLLLSKAQNFNICPYSWDNITDLNIISRYFMSEHFSAIATLLKHGLQWKFSETMYVEYCKRINFDWTWDVSDLSNCDYEESAGRSKHRFFLILQTFFVINDQGGSPDRLQALRLLWRSIPDAVISSEEMLNSLCKFTCLGEDSFPICNTAVWWEDEHLPGPRSLKHISRCSARRLLAKSYRLPCDNLELDIPRCLVGYLNLDE